MRGLMTVRGKRRQGLTRPSTDAACGIAALSGVVLLAVVRLFVLLK